jgi:hypothetical protein
LNLAHESHHTLLLHPQVELHLQFVDDSGSVNLHLTHLSIDLHLVEVVNEGGDQYLVLLRDLEGLKDLIIFKALIYYIVHQGRWSLFI